jgi:hypothetical protein
VFRAAGGVLAQFLAPVQAMLDELDWAVSGPGDGTGGLPDLFDPTTTPPAELVHRGAAGDPQAFLDYLASWLAIRPRPEKPVDWNRRYLRRAIELAPAHGTPPGIEGLLRAWLSGDLLETRGAAPPLVLTDLIPPTNGVDTMFQLCTHSLLGVETVLGEGPPHFFIADLVVDPAVRDLRNPSWLDGLQRSAHALLDAEKPADTYYELRLRGATMQLAPADPADAQPGEIYAQLEDLSAHQPVTGTTLLWDEPWVSGGSLSPFAT